MYNAFKGKGYNPLAPSLLEPASDDGYDHNTLVREKSSRAYSFDRIETEGAPTTNIIYMLSNNDRTNAYGRMVSSRICPDLGDEDDIDVVY